MFGFQGSKARYEAQKPVALDGPLAIIEFSPEDAILSANENFSYLLGEIAAMVVAVDKLVCGIADGAEELNSALADVDTAVARMDRSTQQDAAMAEQASAAFASLTSQVERLNETLGSCTRTRGQPKSDAKLFA